MRKPVASKRDTVRSMLVELRLGLRPFAHRKGPCSSAWFGTGWNGKNFCLPVPLSRAAMMGRGARMDKPKGRKLQGDGGRFIPGISLSLGHYEICKWKFAKNLPKSWGLD